MPTKTWQGMWQEPGILLHESIKYQIRSAKPEIRGKSIKNQIKNQIKSVYLWQDKTHLIPEC